MCIEDSALLIIDLQEDFLPPSGSLAVQEGRDIVPLVNKLSALKWKAVIASKDWHPKDHISFASEHGLAPFSKINISNPTDASDIREQVLWPTHCVQNTHGASFPEEFQPARLDHVVLKGWAKESEFYSAFKDIWGIKETELKNIINDKACKSVYIVGLALDFCVLNTALDAAKSGLNTFLIKDATRAVDPSLALDVIKRLEDEGVSIIESSSLF